MPPFFGFASDRRNITDSVDALAGKSSLSLAMWVPWQYPGGGELPWCSHSSCSDIDTDSGTCFQPSRSGLGDVWEWSRRGLGVV
eukprot:1659661-Prorocentrum_lima.AAC.1